jgi:hypothetical protein
LAVSSFCAGSTTEFKRLGLDTWINTDEYDVCYKGYSVTWEETFWELYEARKRHGELRVGEALPEEVKNMRCWSDASMWFENESL